MICVEWYRKFRFGYLSFHLVLYGASFFFFFVFVLPWLYSTQNILYTPHINLFSVWNISSVPQFTTHIRFKHSFHIIRWFGGGSSRRQQNEILYIYICTSTYENYIVIVFNTHCTHSIQHRATIPNSLFGILER